MNYTKCILLAIVLLGCKTASDKPGSKPIESNEKTLESLLAKFKEVSIDTFEVYSSGDLESADFSFRGERLDSLEMAMLPEKMSEVYRYDRDFYGCYKFSIDSAHVGLIIRTPSEYVASSIKLFVLDQYSKDILDSYIEMAESTGDAGYALTKTSLIFRHDASVNYLIWQHDSEDMSVENENDTTVKTWDYVHLLTFEKEAFDTLSSDTEKLIGRYKQLSRD